MAIASPSDSRRNCFLIYRRARSPYLQSRRTGPSFGFSLVFLLEGDALMLSYRDMLAHKLDYDFQEMAP